MITILVKAADGTLIASAQSADDARLCIDRAYEDGDTVEILADEKHLCVQMDMTLLPGDIIATGTPSGIGSMQRGDTVEVRITGLGTLRNIVR